ncbi:MAG: hypothetical protein IKM00_07205, partial [Clostridia bacterium]|nr:hypothetical protein [Clostridia bacterium]
RGPPSPTGEGLLRRYFLQSTNMIPNLKLTTLPPRGRLFRILSFVKNDESRIFKPAFSINGNPLTRFRQRIFASSKNFIEFLVPNDQIREC